MRAAIFDEEINRLLRETSEALPDGYEVTISMGSAEASITLCDSEGRYVEVNTDDCDFAKSLEQHVKTAVEHASREDRQ